MSDDIRQMMDIHGRPAVEGMAKEAVINVDLEILRMMTINKPEREK